MLFKRILFSPVIICFFFYPLYEGSGKYCRLLTLFRKLEKNDGNNDENVLKIPNSCYVSHLKVVFSLP